MFAIRSTRTLQPQRTRVGFTLTEIAIVLGIVGLILGAIWAAAAKVYANQKVTKATTQLTQIVSGVRGLYSNRSRIDSGDLTQPLVNMGLYPPDMIQTNCAGNGAYTITPSPCPMDPWNGGAVQIGGQVGWWGDPYVAANNFTVMYWNNTMTDCPAFLAAVLQNATSMKLLWVHAQGITDIASPATASVTAVAGCTGYVTLGFAL